MLAEFQGALYRATVTKATSPCTVLFVDYGNSSAVQQVFDITPEIVALGPAQAYKSSIADVSIMHNCLDISLKSPSLDIFFLFFFPFFSSLHDISRQL